MKRINAEWISYRKAYRLYDPNKPQETIAYEDNLDTAAERCHEMGYDLIIRDIDTSNIAGMRKLMRLYGKNNPVFTGHNENWENTITTIHSDRIVIKTLQPNNWIRVNTYYDDETMEETYTR